MKNKNKFLFAFTAVALLTLVSCGKSEEPKNVNPYKDLPNTSDEEVMEDLAVVNAESGVYGNIYLPDEVDGASISWWSSNPEVINPNSNGDIAPGEVNRQNEDVEVNLTAQIEKDGVKTKFDQKVLVKAAPEEIYDEDYCGYLFCHFTGQEGNADHEQIYFALAGEGEGLKFTDMNNKRPVLRADNLDEETMKLSDGGVRDPSIYRSPEGDTYFILATNLSVYKRGGWNNNNGANKFTIKGKHSIVLWESHDLVEWSEPKFIEVAREDAGMAWAPEIIYHEESGQYVIFFSSTIIKDDDDGSGPYISERDCIYYTTTRDFVHFGETKKFLGNQPYPNGQEDSRKQSDSPKAINNNERKIIDAAVIKVGDYYYSAAKDGDNHEPGGILIQRTQDLLGNDWEKMYHIKDLGLTGAPVTLDNSQLEGPEWFHYNVDDRTDPDVDEIGLMADMYMGNKGYLPLSTTDIEDSDNSNNSWRLLEKNKDYYFGTADEGNLIKRHGSIMRLTADEIEAIQEAYKNN